MTEQTSGPKPRLTIGIPTFNFGTTIGETLASIAAAMREGVEIVIVDGGSTDNTSEVVAAWSDRLPLRYHRKSTRDGIDVDIALTVALSTSNYCWLLSADDTIEAGAIATVLSHLVDEPDVVLLSHMNCDAAMRVINARHPVLRGKTRRISIATAADRRRYFADALTTEALFSFLSGLVVRRATWEIERDVSDLAIGSCWSHAVRLLMRMRDAGLVVVYENSAIVRRRGENDSFSTRGLVARYALGIEGYRAIVEQLFGRDSVEYRHTIRVLRAEFTPIMFMYAKRAALTNPDVERLPLLTTMFEHLYPARGRYFIARAIYVLPVHIFIRLFEAANTIRHSITRRSAAG